MKKLPCALISTLLAALLFTVPAKALLSPIPDGIKALMLERAEDPGRAQDCITLNAPDGKQYVFVLDERCTYLSGWKKDGAWQSVLQTSAFDFGANDLRFVPAPSGGAAGFDIVSTEAGKSLSYRWNGEYFSISGWRDPAAWDGSVRAEGNTLHYIGKDGHEQAAVAADDQLTLHIWIDNWSDKPATPKEAIARAAIQQSAVKARFEGWTMGNCSVYNNGTETSAAYYRIEDGLFDIRRAVFRVGEEPEYHDTIPVPLSAALINRLQSEPIDKLIDTSGFDSTFLTQDALDRERIPIPGKVLENDLQRGCLLLLVEETAGRYLYTVRPNSRMGYDIQKSGLLPIDASLDLYHTGDSGFFFQSYGQDTGAAYTDTGSDWALTYLECYREGEFRCHLTGWSATLMQGNIDEKEVLIGEAPFRYLSHTALYDLPMTPEKVRAAMDATHWATVCNPDANSRLHLRAAPDKSASSLGKCWNGTPVRVLNKQGAWTKVRLGNEVHGLTGWMMTKYLAFGDAASQVKRAFPDKMAHEAYFGKNAFRDIAMTLPSPLRLSEYDDFFVVGVVENRLYLLLDVDGNVGYVPQSWLWDGNG